MPLVLLISFICLIAFLVLFRSRSGAGGWLAPQSDYERDVAASEFDEIVLKTSMTTPVLVDFYATWCGPCKDFAPVLSGLAKDYQGRFLLARVNYDQSRALVQRFKVSCVPTVILFDQGEMLERFEGALLPHQIRFFLMRFGIKAS